MKRIVALFLLAAVLMTACPYALAEDPQPIAVIPKEEITPTLRGVHHYMLICVDSWAADLTKEGNHTDGLMLVTVDELAHRVMLTSFIRDMLIMRPDGKFGRVNNIMDLMSPKTKTGIEGKEGIQYLIDTINTHFDLEIEKFIVVDFKQVENIIDAVGGVDITITDREANYLKNYSISASSTTPSISSGGTYHFSGHAAVIYMRIRKVRTADYVHADGETYHDTQDYGRTYRDRVVMTSIADSLKDISYEDATKLLDVIIANTVYTNMTIDDLFSALDIAMDMRGVPVEHIRMPIDNPLHILATPENFNKGMLSFIEFPYAGMATKEVNFEMNRTALHDFLFGTFVVVDDE